MEILVVDDEEIILNDLIYKISSINNDFRIKGFVNPLEALLEVEKGFAPDIVFLDIEMVGLNGLGLAKELQKFNNKINIIFVTGFSEYAFDAFSMHASGYLTKPVRVEALKKEIDNLRFPIKDNHKRILIKTFGNFEVYADGKLVKFGRKKSKEILAYLVDLRGTGCTNQELTGILWEDSEYTRSIQKQLQVLLSDLQKTLRNVNAEDIIIKERNSIAIDESAFECDLYKLLEGNSESEKEFIGKYMSNYSWAEVTLGMLYQKIKI